MDEMYRIIKPVSGPYVLHPYEGKLMLGDSVVAGGTKGLADGLGEAAQFKYPCCLLFHEDFFWIGDSGRLRRMSRSYDVTTVAGSGEDKSLDGRGAAASFSGLCGIAPADRGVLVVEYRSGNVRHVSHDGHVTTVARGLDHPTSIARTSDGYFVSERHRLSLLTLDGKMTRFDFKFDHPRGLTPVHNGGVLLCDGDQVMHAAPDGTVTLVLIIFGSSSRYPGCITWDEGCLVISCAVGPLVRFFNSPVKPFFYLPLVHDLNFAPFELSDYAPFIRPDSDLVKLAWTLKKDAAACFAALYLGSGGSEERFASLRWLTGGAGASPRSGAYGPWPIRRRIVGYLVPLRATRRVARDLPPL